MNVVRFLAAAAWFAASLSGVQAQSAAVGAAVRLGPELADVRAFARGVGDALWPGYGTAPFGFLLVEGNRETLLCRDTAPEGFRADGQDAATGCARWWRPRTGLPDILLAAMPLFGPPAMIVMGTPQATRRSFGEWLRTILHEHFHQWQMQLPDYFARVDALDLKRNAGDQTWMLDYPFSYADPAPAHAYARASLALADALDARGKPNFAVAFAAFLKARERFAASVSDRDWRYLDYEQWFEGGARWAEIELGKRYPRADVRDAAAALEHNTLEVLRRPDLGEQKRELVYPFGAAQFMLLDICGPGWRKDYPKLLALTPLLDAAFADCGRRPIAVVTAP